MPHCQHCGASVDAGAATCGACGRRLVGGSGDGTTAAGGNRAAGGGAGRRDGSGAGAGRPADAGRTGSGPASAGRAIGDAGGRTRRPAHHGQPPGRPPTDVRVVAAILAFLGLSMGVLAFWLLDMGGTASTVGATGPGSTLKLVAVVTGILGIGYLVVAGGLWTVRPWAWQAAVAILAVGSLGTLLSIGAGATGIGPALAFLVEVGALGYLLLQRREFAVAARARHGGEPQ